MTIIDKALVVHVAGLANLDLSDDEVAYYQTQLSKVLDHIEALNDMPDPLPATWRADVLGGPTPERDDIVQLSLDTDVVFSRAPRKAGTAFQVPRIIE